MNLNEFNSDKGVIALMYHRFNENKYPSTNIRNEIFLEHLNEINNSKFEFIPFNKFKLFDKHIPLEIAMEPLSPEKLPGP